MELELATLLMLGGLALLAGFIDTLAGGGGLLTLPGLLLAGLPPVQALATNKLQGTFGSGMATFTLLRLRRFSPAAVRRPFLWALAGSAVGTVVVQVVHTDALQVLEIVRAEVSGNDRAIATGRAGPGFIKLMVVKSRPVGVTIVGPDAGEFKREQWSEKPGWVVVTCRRSGDSCPTSSTRSSAMPRGRWPNGCPSCSSVSCSASALMTVASMPM